MICTDKMIINIFSDTNIDKDERYMLLMFITNTIKGKDTITMSIRTLLEVFECKCKKTVLNVIRSLEKKGYIEIIKSIGKVNQYKVIKYIDDFLSEDTCTSEDTCSVEDTSSKISIGTCTSEDTSDVLKPGDLNKENPSGATENTRVSGSDDKNNNTSNYINNKYINNNKLYIYIFNAWNNLNINNEKILTDENKNAIFNALKEHKEEDIVRAIENYSKVYNGDHYYNYGWTLRSFLSKSNGINRFMEDGDMWLDYKAKQKNVKRNSIFPDDFDIEKYID